jgi:predicted secreted protein/uncharacterized lipoprotein NlpE involved in copper resistance
MPARLIRSLLLSALVLVIACSQEPSPKRAPPASGATDSIVRMGPYVGTMPCADCSGIRTELSLFALHPSGQPVLYTLRETYLGTPDGDRTFTSMGRWTTSHGAGGDSSAAVVEIAAEKPEAKRSFARGEGTLRALDRSGAEIETTIPHTLVLAGPGNPGPLLVAGDRGHVADLRVGQELVVQLPANRSTGFQWSVTDSTAAIAALEGTLYLQDSHTALAVGVGGREYLRFRALAPGSVALHFEYRRPWEPQSEPARKAVVAVSVRP